MKYREQKEVGRVSLLSTRGYDDSIYELAQVLY
jgi:hypothetical protein